MRSISDLEKAGIFLDRALPEIIACAPEKFALSGKFSLLANGGCGLTPLQLRFFVHSAKTSHSSP